ncbi:MAG: hypothetical protein Q9220_002707 [cf. Caloplaca sp. 1 TL-2023]
MADREQPVTLRTRKFIRNPLLGRKQMVVYVKEKNPPSTTFTLSSPKPRSQLTKVPLSTHSDVLHPSRPNVKKDELRSKLAELYKSNKDQVSVFGFRTQYGGGKSTGFALIYDSHEVMKKFEPHYRLVRYGAATKIEKASRQQRRSFLSLLANHLLLGEGGRWRGLYRIDLLMMGRLIDCRETTQEQGQDC